LAEKEYKSNDANLKKQNQALQSELKQCKIETKKSFAPPKLQQH